MMMFNLINYRNIAVSLWLMVLPKLSIMSSLYIQLNLFFLYSFQPYHLLLIFILSYAISYNFYNNKSSAALCFHFTIISYLL